MSCPRRSEQQALAAGLSQRNRAKEKWCRQKVDGVGAPLRPCLEAQPRSRYRDTMASLASVSDPASARRRVDASGQLATTVTTMTTVWNIQFATCVGGLQVKAPLTHSLLYLSGFIDTQLFHLQCTWQKGPMPKGTPSQSSWNSTLVCTAARQVAVEEWRNLRVAQAQARGEIAHARRDGRPNSRPAAK